MSQLAAASRPRSRVVPAVSLSAVAIGAAAGWLGLVGRVAGMDAGPGGDPGALGWFALTWLLMTAAMMFPAAAPAVLERSRTWSTGFPFPLALFLSGYTAIWMAAGLTGYALVAGVRSLHLSLLAWASAGRWLAGGALVAAGLYQLTGAKRHWLGRCVAPGRARSPHRSAGALLAGLEHGGCCVVCCWNVMAALYALGMMSIAWMAVLTALIAGERVLPRPASAVRAMAAVLVTCGVVFALSPSVGPSGAHGAGMRAAMGPPSGRK